MTRLVGLIEKAFADDPLGAAILLDEAMCLYASDLMDEYDSQIQSAIARDTHRRINIAKSALGRQYVETISKGVYPSRDVRQTAEWLAGLSAYADVVSKGVMLEFWGKKQDKRYVARDSAGRFTKVVDTNRSSSATGAPSSKLSPALSSNGHVSNGALSESAKENESTVNRHQAQYEQTDQHIRDLYRMFQGNSKGVEVEINRLKEGNVADPLVFPLIQGRDGFPAAVASQINPLDETILSVGVKAKNDASRETQERIARFNSFGVVSPKMADQQSLKDAFGFSSATESGTDEFFRRMRGISGVLNATGNQKAAAFAELVGTHGAEAEKIIGPYVRQSAYRYRGTEKSPDKELLEEFSSQDMRSVQAGLVPTDAFGVVAGSAKYRAKDRPSKDQFKLEVQSDTAAQFLMRTLPNDLFTAKLSEKSGHVLPSQGVIINADGQVITQAVGYADDHYLPFDLKNLAALRGGQYVRTRVSGGLTGEDMYAAVQSGARMATVVSSSGVFSIEFDPNFRGARGNSDKARQIYGRYLKILDAVDQSGLYLKDIDPSIKDDIKRTAAQYYPGDSADAKALRENYENTQIEQKRQEARDGIDVAALEAEAKQAASKEPGFAQRSAADQARLVADFYDELKGERQREQVQELALNTAGYGKALETLQQQFPYFIRKVSYQPLAGRANDPDGVGFLDALGLKNTLSMGRNRVNTKDSGYVSPGGLRPRSVQSGFYESATTTIPSPKRPGKADESTAERQGAQGGETPKAAGTGDAGSAGGDVSPVPSTSDSPLLKRLAMYEPASKKEVNESARVLFDALQTLPKQYSLGGDMGESAALADENPKSIVEYLFTNPAKLKDLATNPKVVSALSDPGVVRGAFLNIYGFSTLDVTINESSGISSQFNNAKTQNEAVDFVVQAAAKIAMNASLMSPFSSPSSDPYAVAELPRPDQEIMRLDTLDKMKAWMSQDSNKNVARLAGELGENPAPVVKQSVELLKKMKEKSSDAVSESAGKPEEYASRLATLIGVNPETLAMTLGTDVTPATVQPLLLDRRAADLQRAWSLAQAGRVLSIIDDPSGGGSPKVPHPQSGVMKSLALSSRRVDVLAMEHPLTRRVMLNKSLGKPLLSQI
jgi:hypothetical protein